MKTHWAEEALPEGFSFYHLGFIEKQIPHSTSFTGDVEDFQAIGFSISGDLQGLILVLIPKGFDLSIYSELGNILASRMVTKLEGDFILSPPKNLTPDQCSKLATQNSTQTIYYTKYLHNPNSGPTIPIEVLIYA